MKAITLTEPWATLVMCGAKWIETRSWSTSYRGPLAIHAAKTMPPEARQFAHQTPYPGKRVGTMLCWCGWDWRTCRKDHLTTLYPSFVLATATLVDVVPMVARWEHSEWHERRMYDKCVVIGRGGELILVTPGKTPVGDVVSDQEPYGDFRPGRYAWLLADIVEHPDKPWAKGRLGLWEWDETDAA